MSFVDPHSGRPRGTPEGAAPDPDAREEEATATRGRARSLTRRHLDRSAPSDPPIDRPRGSSYRRSVDWERAGLVGVGLLVGALVGAGAALLLAPQSGAATRVAIRRRARAAGFRATDAWDELAEELKAATARRARRARRVLKRARRQARAALA